MDAVGVLGRILETIGKEMQDKDSNLRHGFRLTREQTYALLKMIRIVASPPMQTLTIKDLAKRWHKSQRTVLNWIDLGIVRKGHKTAHYNTHYWFLDEINEDERILVDLGYISESGSTISTMFRRIGRYIDFRR